MISKSKTIFLSFLFSVLIFSPIFAFAAESGGVPPSPPAKVNTGIVYDCQNENGGKAGECTFQDVIKAIQSILNFARNIALEFSVVIIAYAGWMYMTSGDNSKKRSDANNMLWKVVQGIFIVLAAWTIVTFITNALLNSSVPTLLK